MKNIPSLTSALRQVDSRLESISSGLADIFREISSEEIEILKQAREELGGDEPKEKFEHFSRGIRQGTQRNIYTHLGEAKDLTERLLAVTRRLRKTTQKVEPLERIKTDIKDVVIQSDWFKKRFPLEYERHRRQKEVPWGQETFRHLRREYDIEEPPQLEYPYVELSVPESDAAKKRKQRREKAKKLREQKEQKEKEEREERIKEKKKKQEKKTSFSTFRRKITAQDAHDKINSVINIVYELLKEYFGEEGILIEASSQLYKYISIMSKPGLADVIEKVPGIGSLFSSNKERKESFREIKRVLETLFGHRGRPGQYVVTTERAFLIPLLDECQKAREGIRWFNKTELEHIQDLQRVLEEDPYMKLSPEQKKEKKRPKLPTPPLLHRRIKWTPEQEEERLRRDRKEYQERVERGEAWSPKTRFELEQIEHDLKMKGYGSIQKKRQRRRGMLLKRLVSSVKKEEFNG